MDSCADSTLEGYERMRDDRQWGAVIAGLEDNSWLATKEQAAAAFKRELSTLAKVGTKLLPASVARRLLACFSPLVGWLTSTTCNLHLQPATFWVCRRACMFSLVIHAVIVMHPPFVCKGYVHKFRSKHGD